MPHGEFARPVLLFDPSLNKSPYSQLPTLITPSRPYIRCLGSSNPRMGTTFPNLFHKTKVAFHLWAEVDILNVSTILSDMVVRLPIVSTLLWALSLRGPDSESAPGIFRSVYQHFFDSLVFDFLFSVLSMESPGPRPMPSP